MLKTKEMRRVEPFHMKSFSRALGVNFMNRIRNSDRKVWIPKEFVKVTGPVFSKMDLSSFRKCFKRD